MNLDKLSNIIKNVYIDDGTADYSTKTEDKTLT